MCCELGIYQSHPINNDEIDDWLTITDIDQATGNIVSFFVLLHFVDLFFFLRENLLFPFKMIF